MEGGGNGSGEVKVDLVEDGGGVTSAEEKGVRSVEENVEEKMESGEVTDTMDTEQEDVKLQIEDDPEAGTEEGRKKRENEEKEESERGGEEKVGNLDTDNYQGLVEQLRLEFGKGQKISHAVGVSQCLESYSFF